MTIAIITALSLFACGASPEVSGEDTAAPTGAAEETAWDTGGDSGGDPPCVNSLPSSDEAPSLLSETGLFSGMTRPFEPRWPLWTDGPRSPAGCTCRSAG